MKHLIEQPLAAIKPDPSQEKKGRDLQDAPRAFGSPGAITLGLCATSALTDLKDLQAHLQYVASVSSFSGHLPAAVELEAAQKELLNAGLVYFVCHGKFDGARNEPFLGIGPDDSAARHRIYPTTVKGWARADEWTSWDTQRPLVFINGCHTCDLTPGQVLDFVSAFRSAGASGVLGTEVPVQLSLAMVVGKQLLDWLSQDLNVGEAFRRLRWSLANKGNLLGLAYVPYCLADLARAVKPRQRPQQIQLT